MKKIIIFTFFFVSVFSLHALSPLKSYLPDIEEERYETILSGAIVKENTSDGDITLIAPESDSVREKIKNIEAMEKGFAVALATLVPYPDGWDTLSRSSQKLKLYNTLLSVSTMSGLTYISHRAGDKEKTLFKECWMLSSENKKDRVDDPVVDSIPLNREYFAYQDDTSFGGNVYALNYTSIKDEIFLDIKNNNDLKFLGISLVKKGKVNMSLDFIETEEGIFVFALASVKDKEPKVNLLFYTVDLELSYYNRIVALSNWFKGRIAQ